MEIPYLDASAGKVAVSVKLQHSSDVYLLDEFNFNRRQSGQDFNYFGGFFDRTPVTVSAESNVPTRWYLIVDNGSGEQYQYRWL